MGRLEADAAQVSVLRWLCCVWQGRTRGGFALVGREGNPDAAPSPAPLPLRHLPRPTTTPQAAKSAEQKVEEDAETIRRLEAGVQELKALRLLKEQQEQQEQQQQQQGRSAAASPARLPRPTSPAMR